MNLDDNETDDRLRTLNIIHRDVSAIHAREVILPEPELLGGH